jgi:hypothetical protein
VSDLNVEWTPVETVNGVWLNETDETARVTIRCAVSPGYALFIAPADYLTAVDELLEAERMMRELREDRGFGALMAMGDRLDEITTTAARVRSLREGKVE